MRGVLVVVAVIMVASVVWGAPSPQEKPQDQAIAEQKTKRLVVSLKEEAFAPQESEIVTLMTRIREAEKRIGGLRTENASLKGEMERTKQKNGELASLVSLYESAGDVRLIRTVERGGEEVFFAGVGDVRMAEDNGRVIIRLQGESVVTARKLFSRVDRNFINGTGCSYVILDKQMLNAN